jgi:hypothetical protein
MDSASGLRRAVVAVAIAAALPIGAGGAFRTGGGTCLNDPGAAKAFVRLDLVGYATHSAQKRAYVLSPVDEGAAPFDVLDV